MIAYNISIKINPTIEKDWVQWQKEEHIPEIMALGYFTDYKFYRLLDQDETENITYVIQYFTPALEQYEKYVNNKAPLLRQKAFEKWEHNFIAFRTIMEVVN